MIAPLACTLYGETRTVTPVPGTRLAELVGLAGLLKVTRGVSEVISTIMLNAIAITLAGYLLNRYGDHVGNGVRTTPLEEGSRLSGFTLFSDRDGAVWTLCFVAVARSVSGSGWC